MNEATVETSPRWRAIAVATVIAGLVMLPLLREGAGLYFYAFPLFGLGIPYVLQYRTLLTRPWWVTFVAITPLSIVALALDWAFSGHVLWNVLFLGHDAMVVRSRRWAWLLVASLVHLVVLKAAFQRPRDVVGAFVSAGLAALVLLVLRRVTAGRAR